MDVMTLGLLVGALLMAIGGGLVFVAAVRSGQFDEIEDVKFELFREGRDRADTSVGS